MRFLMCPPLHYGAEHESDRQIAQDQWRKLYRLLDQELDMAIAPVEPRQGLPDMVFTANAGFVWKEKFIASNFHHEARREELPHFENWFQVRGYEIYHLPKKNFFEGERDFLTCGNLLFAGYHDRSDVASHQKVAEIVERDIVSLQLSKEWPYHLDTCFCPVGQGQALYYPGAFVDQALKMLEGNIETLVPVAGEETQRFACNAIVIEKDVIINDGCPQVREKLKSLGMTVFETPLGEFIKAGGSAKCLVLKVPHNKPPDPGVEKTALQLS